jgi:hypothetical protein
VTAPSNLRELVLHLNAHPRVRITFGGPREETIEATFNQHAWGDLWFTDEAGNPWHIPVPAMRSSLQQDARGITYDETGCTVVARGREIRVEYLE